MPTLPSMDRMREEVIIQAFAGTDDSFGEKSETWATLATVRAEVIEESADETVQATRRKSLRRLTVNLRYYTGLTAKHRFLFETRILNIGGVTNPDGVKRFHSCSCTEVA